uniref:Uncharacterized protein n=1 Tax=Anguilla anguilla TaxID=7936 RepID=A0A0E9XPB4_ANGAN
MFICFNSASYLNNTFR